VSLALMSSNAVAKCFDLKWLYLRITKRREDYANRRD
jgi:hypothetical protein